MNATETQRRARLGARTLVTQVIEVVATSVAQLDMREKFREAHVYGTRILGDPTARARRGDRRADPLFRPLATFPAPPGNHLRGG